MFDGEFAVSAPVYGEILLLRRWASDERNRGQLVRQTLKVSRVDSLGAEQIDQEGTERILSDQTDHAHRPAESRQTDGSVCGGSSGGPAEVLSLLETGASWGKQIDDGFAKTDCVRHTLLLSLQWIEG